MEATLIEKATGKEIRVCDEHNYPGYRAKRSVWVDPDGKAYFQVGDEENQTEYIVEIDEPWNTWRKIGKSIAKIRKERGISQYELADRVGVAQSYIAVLEIGRRGIGFGILTRIAKVLGCEVALVPKPKK